MQENQNNLGSNPILNRDHVLYQQHKVLHCIIRIVLDNEWIAVVLEGENLSTGLQDLQIWPTYKFFKLSSEIRIL